MPKFRTKDHPDAREFERPEDAVVEDGPTDCAGPSWHIYIPEEGHWPIDYGGDSERGARLAYLKWAGRKRLPAGSAIQRL